jgi:hypothetical protein
MQAPHAIAVAVYDALLFVGDGDDRVERLTQYLSRLEGDPQWNATDILAVQSRVSRAMDAVEPSAPF